MNVSAKAHGAHRWQQNIPDDKNITQLSIPGSHDSCARLNLPYGKCQNMKIGEQLNIGIRFLDIRCRHIENAFTIHHGLYYLKMNFDDVLTVCRDFLKENPSEFIIMSVKEEHKAEKTSRGFEETFLSYIGKYPGLFNTGRTFPQVGEARGKIVVFSRYSPCSVGIYAGKWEDNAAFDTGTRIKVQDKYMQPILKKDKWEDIQPLLDEAEMKPHDGVLYINYCSGTNVGMANAAKIIARNTNKKLYNFCKTKKNKRYGILVLDYPELPFQDLTKRIIYLNFD